MQDRITREPIKVRPRPSERTLNPLEQRGGAGNRPYSPPPHWIPGVVPRPTPAPPHPSLWPSGKMGRPSPPPETVTVVSFPPLSNPWMTSRGRGARGEGDSSCGDRFISVTHAVVYRFMSVGLRWE